jgi:hypothetical protein
MNDETTVLYEISKVNTLDISKWVCIAKKSIKIESKTSFHALLDIRTSKPFVFNELYVPLFVELRKLNWVNEYTLLIEKFQNFDEGAYLSILPDVLSNYNSSLEHVLSYIVLKSSINYERIITEFMNHNSSELLFKYLTREDILNSTDINSILNDIITSNINEYYKHTSIIEAHEWVLTKKSIMHLWNRQEYKTIYSYIINNTCVPPENVLQHIYDEILTIDHVSLLHLVVSKMHNKSVLQYMLLYLYSIIYTSVRVIILIIDFWSCIYICISNKFELVYGHRREISHPIKLNKSRFA